MKEICHVNSISGRKIQKTYQIVNMLQEKQADILKITYFCAAF